MGLQTRAAELSAADCFIAIGIGRIFRGTREISPLNVEVRKRGLAAVAIKLIERPLSDAFFVLTSVARYTESDRIVGERHLIDRREAFGPHLHSPIACQTFSVRGSDKPRAVFRNRPERLVGDAAVQAGTLLLTEMLYTSGARDLLRSDHASLDMLMDTIDIRNNAPFTDPAMNRAMALRVGLL